MGKGGFKRAIKSAASKSAEHNDDIVSLTWKKASNSKNAFIDEYMMQKKRGVLSMDRNAETYNRIWSPGKNIYWGDKMNNYDLKDGFVFGSISYPYNVYDAIIIKQNGRSTCESPQYNVPTKSIDEYIDYINLHNVQKATIILDDISFLDQVKSLKYLNIIPSYESPLEFDFSPLYRTEEVKGLSCRNQYGYKDQHTSFIDLMQIKGIECLGISINKRTLNYNKLQGLKSLLISNYKNIDLSDLICSTQLDTISFIQCGIHSLNGIQKSNKLQCLYLDYNRSLNDISALVHAKETLKLLRIDSCSKIEDFSVLGDLENLELLELNGNNVLPDLDFLKTMKNLQTFVFNVNVLNGDLNNCKTLSYVYSGTDRKHYNLKNKDLPKGKYTRGNESIEEWRRLE